MATKAERSDADEMSTALLQELGSHASAANVAGMSRYGINPHGTLGVPMPVIRDLARGVKRRLGRGPAALSDRHSIARSLWASGVHEARILAALVDVPALVDQEQMEQWVLDLDSWDICDQLCGNLFDKTDLAWEKAAEWSARPEEFVKRAGFVLMTQLAVHDKQAEDQAFRRFFPLIARESTDGRPMVKKAVNWALRQIGKRNAALRTEALGVAESILAENSDSASARWVARDAIRELRSQAVVSRTDSR